MTKWSRFSLGACRHPIADVHLCLMDDDPINKQCDQVSALGKGQLVKGRLKTLAKRLDSLGQRHHIHVLVRLSLELP
jgi:hypothetical protein